MHECMISVQYMARLNVIMHLSVPYTICNTSITTLDTFHVPSKPEIVRVVPPVVPQQQHETTEEFKAIEESSMGEYVCVLASS